MEAFINSVGSQIFSLSHLDAIVQMVNVQFVMVYQNKGEPADFMPSELLRQSFYRTLQQFPILAGHIREVEHGMVHVVVDRGNLNMPEYNESASSLHYSELSAAKFSWARLPKDIVMAPLINVDASGAIKNVKVDIRRLRDNSGLIVSLGIPHILVDDEGYFAFLNLWADTCKGLRLNTTAVTKEQASLAFDSLAFDRGVLKKYLPLGRKPVDPASQWLYTHPSAISGFLSWLSTTTRIRLLNSLTKGVSTESHMFHISRDSLDRLHLSVKESAPSGTRLSSNDIIAALLSKTFAQSEATPEGELGLVGRLCESALGLARYLAFRQRDKSILVGIPCDARYRLGMTGENYMGNATIGPCLKYTSSELSTPTTPESLATVALRVRLLVDMVDAEYVASLLDEMASNPSFHTQLYACPIYSSVFTLSNHTRAGLYKADFGDGIQRWTSFVPGLKSTVAMIQPCPPGADGVNIYVEAEARAMRNVLANKFWMNVAELIY